MGKRKYPRFGSIRKHDPRGMCKICRAVGADNRADATLEIQFNIFRGDDEVYKVHFRKCWLPLGANNEERMKSLLFYLRIKEA